MDILTWGRSPWGEWMLTHISWDLLWAALFAGVAFLLAHASYVRLSRHDKRPPDETDALETAHRDLPPRIVRHSGAARAFHWVMALAITRVVRRAFSLAHTLPRLREAISALESAWIKRPLHTSTARRGLTVWSSAVSQE